MCGLPIELNSRNFSRLLQKCGHKTEGEREVDQCALPKLLGQCLAHGDRCTWTAAVGEVQKAAERERKREKKTDEKPGKTLLVSGRFSI